MIATYLVVAIFFLTIGICMSCFIAMLVSWIWEDKLK